MPRINLLPWREQERKVRRREFMVAAGAAVFSGVVVMFVGWACIPAGSTRKTRRTNS
jgi:type IV pilus assembly protein PilN